MPCHPGDSFSMPRTSALDIDRGCLALTLAFDPQRSAAGQGWSRHLDD